jgi:glucose-6-phosphate isomerase
VLESRSDLSPAVYPTGTISGDYLNGFALGTAKALYANRTGVIQIPIDTSSDYALGVLTALYEHAVGFYANLANINTYHQPSVEVGKTAGDKS